MITSLAASSFIWFREGLEAFLIIQATWMLTTNTRQRLALTLSTLLAIASSITLGYFAIEYIQKDFDRVEAYTALVASALLFWTAWFCHGASQHLHNIKHTLTNNQVKGTVLALAVIVYLTVFREGAEIVAFLSALYVAGASLTSIGLGAVIGLGALGLVGYTVSKRVQKIPVAKIFKTSRWLFMLMAVYFLYYGIHELLE